MESCAMDPLRDLRLSSNNKFNQMPPKKGAAFFYSTLGIETDDPELRSLALAFKINRIILFPVRIIFVAFANQPRRWLWVLLTVWMAQTITDVAEARKYAFIYISLYFLRYIALDILGPTSVEQSAQNVHEDIKKKLNKEHTYLYSALRYSIMRNSLLLWGTSRFIIWLAEASVITYYANKLSVISVFESSGVNFLSVLWYWCWTAIDNLSANLFSTFELFSPIKRGPFSPNCAVFIFVIYMTFWTDFLRFIWVVSNINLSKTRRLIISKTAEAIQDPEKFQPWMKYIRIPAN